MGEDHMREMMHWKIHSGSGSRWESGSGRRTDTAAATGEA